jgi:competence protein ComEC
LAHQFSIGVVYVTPQMSSSNSRAVKRLFETLEVCGVPVKLISEGDQLFSDSGALVRVMGPPFSGNAGNDNSNSVVLVLEYLGKKILLPGDLEQAGLDRLLDSQPIHMDLVMAAHHGSKNSGPKAFMKWSTPKYVVISGGSQRVTDRMIQRFGPAKREVARTDVDGAIRYSIDKSGTRFERWGSMSWR